MCFSKFNAYLPLCFTFFIRFAHTVFMPTSFTHYHVAKHAFLSISSPLRRAVELFPDAYYFGAQGADFCFFLPVKKYGQLNFGRFLHRGGGYGFFKTLAEFSQKNPLIFAYSLGFITHYAADVALHPYVYSLSGSSKLLHARVEGSFDKFLSNGISKREETEFLKTLKPEKSLQAEWIPPYLKYAVEQGYRPFQAAEFSRAISLFNAYTAASFPFSKRAKPPFSKEKLYNENHSPWRYPADPTIQSFQSVDELLQSAIRESLRLFQEFSSAVENKIAPLRELFGKNYVSGLL